MANAVGAFDLGKGSIEETIFERGIDFAQVAAQAGQPDADPFDLLCHLAFNAPVLTRRQRADRVKRQQAAFFNYYAPEAREILNDKRENEDKINGMNRMAQPQRTDEIIHPVNPVYPVCRSGVNEIIGKFGGEDQLRNAVNQLQSLLYMV